MRSLKQVIKVFTPCTMINKKTGIVSVFFGLALISGCSTLVQVPALYETPQVISPDDAADDPAIWLNSTVPAQSLIFGTDKQSGVYSYNLQGETVGYTELGKINNIDTRSVDANTYIVASNRTQQSVDMWRFADSAMAEAAAKGDFSLPAKRFMQGQSKINIYGACMGLDKRLGLLAFVTEDEGPRVEVWKYTADGLRLLHTFDNGGESEGCVYDDENQILLISEEEVNGVLRAYSVTEALDFSNPVIIDSREGNIGGDPEGVTLYKTSATEGYIVLSSQGDSKFNLYNRTAPYAYLGSFEVGEVGTVDGVSITDGIAAINYPLNEDFPRGLLVVQDNDNIGKKKRKPKRQNFKLISFADVIDALQLK
ncbi:3-phytase precursor [Gammaproteobacteria bacterium MOLA455]|nr:3-phytase precursor [Gammaproteobacteria bacterium MOLA455]